MATKTLYLGNIPFDATEQNIRDFFSPHKIFEVRIIVDRDTGRSKGFAFVEMEAAQAMTAIASLDGVAFGGRTAKVSEANERKKDNRREQRSRDRRGRGDDDIWQ